MGVRCVKLRTEELGTEEALRGGSRVLNLVISDFELHASLTVGGGFPDATWDDRCGEWSNVAEPTAARVPALRAEFSSQSKSQPAKKLERVFVSTKANAATLRKISQEAAIFASATLMARDLINTPASDCRPRDLVQAAKEIETAERENALQADGARAAGAEKYVAAGVGVSQTGDGVWIGVSQFLRQCRFRGRPGALVGSQGLRVRTRGVVALDERIDDGLVVGGQ